MLFLLTNVPLDASAASSSVPITIVGHSSQSGVVSINWGGYAVTEPANSVTSAEGSWVVPAAKCGATQTTYAAFWVGIDGFGSKTVEQTGTDSDCSLGAAKYYAWYEFYPKLSKTIGTMTVKPGDVMEASVVWDSGVTFTVTIQDQTTGQSFTTSGTVSGASRASAEFIAESPEICHLLKCKIASLTDFGTVGFGADNTAVTATCNVGVNGADAALGTYGSAIQEVTLVSQANHSLVRAQPSAISTDGTSFTIQWLHS